MNILFFSPNAFLDVHAVPEAIVSKALVSRGHKVVHVNCNGILGKYCISMSAAGVEHFDEENTKKNICNICKLKSKEIAVEFKQKNILLDEFITDEDLFRIDKIISEVNQENWFQFIYEGISVGKYAAYELVLNEKIKSYKFTELQWQKYIIDLHNVMKVYIAYIKIFLIYKPERVVIYNNLYSINSVVCAVSNKFGVSCYSLHAGGHHVYMYSQMTIFKGRGARRYSPYSVAWEKIKDKPLSNFEINNVALHINELLKATSPWVYSSRSTNKNSAELLTLFNIRNNQKVALVTMSSEDEKFAGSLVDVPHQRGEPIYKDNLEWISFLVEWARVRSDIKLIIRVHPREFPNKRESVLSQQAKILKDYFVDLPENVVVNWPDDNISLYDLLKIVDIGLNSSSTAGLEMLLFGIPVVIIDENQLVPYPLELNLFSNNKEDYIKKINSALLMPWSLSNVIAAYRWLSFVNHIESIDISDGYSKAENSFYSKFKRYFLSKKKINPIISTVYEFTNSPVKASEWLVYAIESNDSCHMDKLILENKSNTEQSTNNERREIVRNLKKIHNKFIRNDKIFENKIRRLGF